MVEPSADRIQAWPMRVDLFGGGTVLGGAVALDETGQMGRSAQNDFTDETDGQVNGLGPSPGPEENGGQHDDHG